MARPSDTRVELTVEALGAASRFQVASCDSVCQGMSRRLERRHIELTTELDKFHHFASEWKNGTLSDDGLPVPSNVPNAHEYTNRDVNALPHIDMRLRLESPMAKYYVVPSTVTTPYATLPDRFS
jgi:hypothetical protein